MGRAELDRFRFLKKYNSFGLDAFIHSFLPNRASAERKKNQGKTTNSPPLKNRGRFSRVLVWVLFLARVANLGGQ
jgi:hypothetical protein